MCNIWIKAEPNNWKLFRPFHSLIWFVCLFEEVILHLKEKLKLKLREAITAGLVWRSRVSLLNYAVVLSPMPLAKLLLSMHCVWNFMLTSHCSADRLNCTFSGALSTYDQNSRPQLFEATAAVIPRFLWGGRIMVGLRLETTFLPQMTSLTVKRLSVFT